MAFITCYAACFAQQRKQLMHFAFAWCALCIKNIETYNLEKVTLDLNSPPVLTPEQTAKCELLRGKLRALYRKDQFAIHKKVLVWHDQLKVKYPNARDYMMFHLISGSTFKGFNGLFDFPAADSVELFIETQYRAAFPTPEADRPVTQ